MNKDILNISFLYEELNRKKYDYLHLENTDNFDWNSFHEEYELQKFYLSEAFRHILDKKTSAGVESVYELTAPTDLVYNLRLNWIIADNKIWDETSSFMMAKNNNSKDLDKYEDVLNLVKQNNDKHILYVYFETSSGETAITNKTEKNESFVIFKGLENAVKDFLILNNRLDDTLMVRFFVNKDEPKRMKLYENIIRRIDTLKKFHNTLVDSVNDSNYNIITIF